MTVNFPEFIEKKYLEWQNREGKRKSIEEFAMYIGVSQSALSLWMGGKRTPSAQTVHLLAEIFGNEVYDALGLPRPNPYLQIVNRRWEYLDEETQKRIAEEVAQYETQNENKRIQKTPKPRKAGNHQ
ncbi:MAG: helix-turn-helix transcriptional regulator [Rhodospirillales bacterium]|nr:helix-turn-helix transcriptional regulator [Rhodospirillales bacterium]